MDGLYVIIAFVLGFLVAQLWKLFAGLMSHEKPEGVTSWQAAIGYFSRSGGMPSGHAASMTAMTICLGGMYGWTSGIFALAVGMWAIILYDAIHVRYAVGEQGKVLNEVAKREKLAVLPVVEGHTLAQVVVGVVLGAITGGLILVLV